MTIAPYAAGSLASRRSGDLFVSMRRQLDDLQRQMSTGQKAETYGGLGFDRGTSLDFQAKIAALDGYDGGIDDAQFRLKMMVQTVQTVSKAGQDAAGALLPPNYDPGADGRTSVQRSAEAQLKLAIDALNTDINGRYLFAGRAVNQKPVASYDAIMNGPDGLIAKVQARIGAALGTATQVGGVDFAKSVVGTADVLTFTDPASPSGSGFTVDSGSVTGPGGAAPSGNVAVSSGSGSPLTVTFNGQPADGETISLTVKDAGGVSHTMSLTARASGPVDANSFAIGATPSQTIDNFTAALKGQAQIILAPQAALDAANDVFAAGTWYQGDSGGSARDTAPLRIDSSEVVGTGARANEDGIRTLLASLAAVAAFPSGTYGAATYEAFSDQARTALTQPSGQTVDDIAVDLGNATSAMSNAKDRHAATKAMLQGTLDQVQQASPEQVAASLLALQTRMQASYQTTAMLSKLSLVNYL